MRLRRVCSLCALGLVFSIPLFGQTSMQAGRPVDANQRRAHLGFPQSWSARHLLMPGASDDAVLAAAKHDPRYLYSLVMRHLAANNPHRKSSGPAMKIDWAVSLENGFVAQDQFPAKYQFDVTAQDCTNDYIVFGLTGASTTNANLVGINNLYSGVCANSPSVAFAFNTALHGGQIKTSPELSEDGTKVAFVESTASASYLHVLVLPSPLSATPNLNGTVLAPRTPTSCATPTTPLCMTDLAVETTATNSNSSPWIDYNTDTAYVGADNGILYKITPVFGGGTPALVNDPGNWPVTVSANARNNILTAPVVDDVAGMIFIGDGAGYLYSVNLAAPGKTFAAQQTVGWAYDGTKDGSGGAGTGIVDAPIAVTDPANPTVDQVFAFTGCSNVPTFGAGVTQLPANFTTGTATVANTVNLGAASGSVKCTGDNIHSGAFDNQFWLSGSTTGHLIACGYLDNGGLPAPSQMYFLPFLGNVITSTGSSTFQIATTKGQECSPLTEFYNGSSDMLFFSIGNNSGSQVESSTITTSLTIPNCTKTATTTCVSAPNAVGGTSGIVIDNLVSNGGTNIYFSTLAGGSVNAQKCPNGGVTNPNCAVKLTQTGLQ